MLIIVAPNAFKGSLSVLEAARAMRDGVKQALPAAEVAVLPIADGGDGLIDALLAARGGGRVHVVVRGPLGERRQAAFGRLSDGTAVIEMALASGLALVPRGKNVPMLATSFGTGQLIDAALSSGARTIVIGLGGSASSDGGAGMAQALGCRLLDKEGRELAAGVAALGRLDRIDCGALRRRLRGVKVVGLTDVTNPLLGPTGSAAVYGPQKGATPVMVKTIEAHLTRYARVVNRDIGVDVASVPGAGAAGGLGAGLLAFLRARLSPGAEYVCRHVGLERLLPKAAAVVTGEGRLDATSFYGKGPLEVALMAKHAGVPVACVCGVVDAAIRARLPRYGVRAAVGLEEAGARGAGALRNAARWTAKASALAVKSLGLACVLAVGALASDGNPYMQVDGLYYHRNEPGKLEAAQTALEKLSSISGADAGLWWRMCRVLVRVGEKKDKRRDKLELFQRAEDAADKAIALNPQNPEAHFWRGVALGRYGQTKGILKSLSLIKPIRAEMNETLRWDPNHGGAHHVLGEMLWEIPGFAGGDKRKALEEFETAVRLTPNYSANYPSLARAYVKFGWSERARALLTRLEGIKEPADPADYMDDLKETREIVEKAR